MTAAEIKLMEMFAREVRLRNALQPVKDYYDFIFIDPPSFSNSKRMQDTFDVQRDHVALLKDAFRCLNDGGEVMFSNNRRGFKLDADALAGAGYKDIEDITAKTIPEDFARHANIHQCWTLKK